MYSQKVILENLEDFAKREGWMPVYHTLAQVEEFKAYITSITKIDSNSKNSYINITAKLTKKRADEIRRWIENEQALCALDSEYWETRYAYITDNQSNIFKFQNRKSQEVFDSIIAKFDEDGVAIELMILKARQLGVTTKVALKFLHRLLFLPHTQAVMASNNADKSELIGRMIQVCLDHLPWWLIPRTTTDRIKLTEFDNGSILAVQSGSQATGIAQGWTPTLVHISEIGDIPNPKKVLEEGLFKATHPTRKLFAVYEGTGNGNTGWQADKWRSAKENFPKGLSRICPVFLPWPTATDQYPEPDWLKKFPVPHDFQPHSMTRKHVLRCELYIRNTEYLARIMGKNWKMPVEQQWYWQFNYDDAVRIHAGKTWLQQMPADDFEALQGKNDSVFDDRTIEVCMEKREKDYQAYAIISDTIDEGFEPKEEIIDYDLPRIRVKHRSHRGQVYEWVMVPLKAFDDEEEKNTLDKILVFEEPKQGSIYSIGIDTADGLGKEDEDRSVLSVTRNEKDDGCDVQVCEFVSNRINAPQMVGFAACIASWYGEADRDPRGSKFCIEQRERPGDDCQLQLKLMGFNHHHRDVSYDNTVVKEHKSSKEGWYTRPHTRPMLLNRFSDAITNGWYKPNSKWLIQEAKDIERKVLASGKSKVEHQSGKHDDRYLAAAMSYFTRHALDIMADRATKRYAVPTGKKPQVDYSFDTSSEVAVGDW